MDPIDTCSVFEVTCPGCEYWYVSVNVYPLIVYVRVVIRPLLGDAMPYPMVTRAAVSSAGYEDPVATSSLYLCAVVSLIGMSANDQATSFQILRFW